MLKCHLIGNPGHMPWKHGSCDQTVPPPCGCKIIWHSTLLKVRRYIPICPIFIQAHVVVASAQKFYSRKQTSTTLASRILEAQHVNSSPASNEDTASLCTEYPRTLLMHVLHSPFIVYSAFGIYTPLDLL